MPPIPIFKRPIASLAVAVLVVSLAIIPTRRGMGQGEAGGATALPADLLKAQPFDRITLTDNSVWTIEPVSPRPLPVFDAVKAREAAKAKEKAKGVPPPEGNVGVPKAKGKAKEDVVPEDLVIHLMEGDVRDYKIKRTNLKKIEYFEDFLLAEGDKLVDAKDFAKAFEHYLLVKARTPAWKGLDERVDKLLYEEGSWALAGLDRDRGVRLLRELSARKPNYPGLGEKLALAYKGRIDEAFEKGLYPFARKVLHDLESVSPGNPLARATRDRFETKAKALVDGAMKAEGAGRLEGLTEALRVWPTYEGAAEKYTEAFRAMPTLDVAVIDLPRPAGPFVRSPAGERVAKLLYLPLLADESEDAARGKAANQLVASLETSDIGRKIDLTLKEGPAWSDGSRSVGAIDVVRSLADRAQPRSPGYSARWADILNRVEIADEQRVTITLNRPVLKPEAWLLDPVGPAHAAWDGRVPKSDGTRKPVGDGPFASESEGENVASYRSAEDSKTAGSPPAIRRVREVRFSDGAAALGALVRGDVTLVEHVAPDRLEALKQEPEIRIGRYSRPSLHRIAIDGRNVLLRNRSLRRGIAYAIDRKSLLEETVLKRPTDEVNGPSDGAFAFDSDANAPDVPPYKSDAMLARMLVAAGKTEMKATTVKLTFEYPAIPEAQAAAPKIAEALRAAGLEITLVERSETELEEALRSGRKFDLAYRASRCSDPIREIGPMICPGYDAPSETDSLASIASPRIMQLLLQLEHAQESVSARDLVAQIDRECHDELPMIPLWQLRDHFAYRGRLSGPVETADRLYQGIDRWQIEPWFARDPW